MPLFPQETLIMVVLKSVLANLIYGGQLIFVGFSASGELHSMVVHGGVEECGYAGIRQRHRRLPPHRDAARSFRDSTASGFRSFITERF